MLQRMYTRWGERRGFAVKVVDLSDADEGCGIRSAELTISGANAYGLLALEKGTHRLVRISPFNSLGKRQTSFAGVETLPILPDQDLDEVPDIPDKDLSMSFMRSGGAGGQNVNKVESGVLLRHLPTGLMVKCTQERSQLQNRAIALKILKAKLLVVQREQQVASWSEIRGDAVDANFGQQIRNYVLHPYKLAKDTRSGFETSNVKDLLDGGLDALLAANLRHTHAQLSEGS
jgi:peptide chain release factor 2